MADYVYYEMKLDTIALITLFSNHWKAAVRKVRKLKWNILLYKNFWGCLGGSTC